MTRSLSQTGASAALLLLLAACTATPPPAETGSTPEAVAAREPARLFFGATEAEAREGRRSAFVLEATPDLVLHAELPGAKYEGQTLLVRGTAPGGLVAWSFPHVQRGRSIDVVLRVLGSAAAQRHLGGVYAVRVTAPDGAVLAEGAATLASRYAALASARRPGAAGVP